MAASIFELLQPQIVLGVWSLLKRGRGPIGSWLGFHPTDFNRDSVTLSGPNTMTTGTTVDQYIYRIFNETRVPLNMTAPGAPAQTMQANPLAQNTVSMARWHQKIPLMWSFLGNLSAMAGPNSQIDTNGQNYIAEQTAYGIAKGNRTVEFLAAAMLRDSLYIINTGENWRPQFVAPTATQFGIQVNFQIPAGNKNQGNMLGDGNIITTPWTNTGARILGNCLSIRAAYAQLSAYGVTDTWINSVLWDSIITNTEVRNTAGSSNMPFAMFDTEGMESDNHGPPSYRATLRGLPGHTFRLCDDTAALGADLDPINSATAGPAVATLSKLVPDNLAIFCPDPGAGGEMGWTKLVYGSEMISENYGQPAVRKTGWSTWHMYSADPSCIILYFLLKCIPILPVPNVVAPLTVAGF